MPSPAGGRAFKWEWLDRFELAGLSPAAMAVGTWLAIRADGDGTNSYPGNPRLVRTTGFSIATVKRAIHELRDAKWIEPDDPRPVDKSGPGRPANAWKLRFPTDE